MVKRCCWGTCNSDTRYPERIVNIKFIPFPKPKTNYDACLRWIKACGRPNDQLNVNKITKDIYVCSKHFVNGEPSEKNPDPIPATGGQIYAARRGPKKRKLCESACTDINPDDSLSQDLDNILTQDIFQQNEKETQTEEVVYSNLDILAYTSTIHNLEQEKETLHQENKKLKQQLASYIEQDFVVKSKRSPVMQKWKVVQTRKFSAEDVANSGFKHKVEYPPFASTACQMSAGDVALTRKIAAHRIHIERSINQIKNFKLVNRRIPGTLFHNINEIWTVCSLLTNFQDTLVKK